MNIEQKVVSKFRGFDIEEGLFCLLPEERAAIVLHYYEDLTYEGVARRLGVERWKVKKWIHQGLRTLRWRARRLHDAGGKVKTRIEVASGYPVEYIESFYSTGEADALLRALLAVDMQPEIIRMYGRDTVTKRRSGQYGADYIYNPTAKKSREWTPLMLSIRERLESIAGPLDGGLVQVYPDGEAGIGWHEDKGKPEIIASLSLGAEREFAFGVGPATKCREVWRMPLAHGSLLLIPGTTNEALKHRLPPARRIRQPRVNVTLRRFPVG
jgi:alkylated DNA repair dioxygenase AlkB